MLDNDEAGRMAAQRILTELGASYDVKAVFPKQGKDFNEELTASIAARKATKSEMSR